MLRLGLLPQIQTEPDYAVEVLEAYVANYIREEIQQEALVRNLDSFARFLEVAALVNGQVVNVAGIARDAAVARPTVQGYFATLVDTLIGFWLPAWRKRAEGQGGGQPEVLPVRSGRGAGAGRTAARAARRARTRVPARDLGAARTARRHGVAESRRAACTTGARRPAARWTSSGRAARAPSASR